MQNLKCPTILIAAGLATFLLVSCDKNDDLATPDPKPNIAAALPSAAAKNPTSNQQMFISARFIAANGVELPLVGDWGKFSGTLLDSSVKSALADNTDIKTNELWPVISRINGLEVFPGTAIASPVGKFAFFGATNRKAGKTYIVTVNLDTNKTAILDSQYGVNTIHPGDFLNAAAIWAYKAHGVVSEFESSIPTKATLQMKRDLQAMAVGYLYAAESFSNDAALQLSSEKTPIEPKAEQVSAPTDMNSLPLGPHTTDSIRKWALGRTNEEIKAAFGKPYDASELQDGQGTSLWLYSSDELQVQDPLSGTYVRWIKFRISNFTKRVTQVSF